MRTFYYILYFTILSGTFIESTAQNLVPNGSFETYSSCPTNFNQLNLATPWYDPTLASSDYFNACNLGSQNVPFSSTGFQYARTGGGYAGIWCVNSYGSNYREYIQVQLDSSLKQDSCYLIEFYCSLNNVSRYGIKKLGAFLSSIAVSDVGPFPSGLVLQHIPQIESTTDLNDTLNWMRVRGFYTANGGEQFLTIGNFRTDSLTDTIHVGGGNYNGSYYLIEDVRVEKIINCDTTVGIIENTYFDDQIKLSPNPNNGEMNVVYSLPEGNKGELKFYDVSGRIVGEYLLQPGINTQLFINKNELENGIYFYSVYLDSKQTFTGKVVIVK